MNNAGFCRSPVEILHTYSHSDLSHSSSEDMEIAQNIVYTSRKFTPFVSTSYLNDKNA